MHILKYISKHIHFGCIKQIKIGLLVVSAFVKLFDSSFVHSANYINEHARGMCGHAKCWKSSKLSLFPASNAKFIFKTHFKN